MIRVPRQELTGRVGRFQRRAQFMVHAGLVLAVVMGCGSALLFGYGSSSRQASAGSRWERQVRDLLRQAGARIERQGYQLTHDVHTGVLRDSDSETLTLTLDSEVIYVVGVCDADCDDLDLELFDQYGSVARDFEADDVPLLNVRPRSGGTYRLRVTMASCSSAPCWYGIGVFGR